MRRNSHLTLAIAGFAAAVLLAVAGGLLLWGSTYVHNTVQNQLPPSRSTSRPRPRSRTPRRAPRSPRT